MCRIHPVELVPALAREVVERKPDKARCRVTLGRSRVGIIMSGRHTDNLHDCVAAPGAANPWGRACRDEADIAIVGSKVSVS